MLAKKNSCCDEPTVTITDGLCPPVALSGTQACCCSTSKQSRPPARRLAQALRLPVATEGLLPSPGSALHGPLLRSGAGGVAWRRLRRRLVLSAPGWPTWKGCSGCQYPWPTQTGTQDHALEGLSAALSSLRGLVMVTDNSKEIRLPAQPT